MRILPPLPATAQLAPAATPPGVRILAAEVLAPLGDDLYQVLAGQLRLEVRSTTRLQPGQQIQLQLPRQDAPPAGTVPATLSPSGMTAVAMPAVASTSRAQPAQMAAAPAAPPLILATPSPADYRELARLASLTTPIRPDTREGTSRTPAPRGSADSREISRTTPRADAVSPSPASNLNSPREQARQQIQQLMPHQQDPSRLVALLRALQPALAEPATSPLQVAASHLLASLPDVATLDTPEAIQRMLRDSGLVSEAARPAQAGTADAHDLKQALQAVRDAAPQSLPSAPARHGAPAGHLQPLPTPALPLPGDSATLLLQLAAEIEPVLARLETHQLMHLQPPDPQVQQWLFELPLRQGQDINLWQLHVEKDARQMAEQSAGGDNLWSLTLSVDFPETGALMIRLGLQNGHLHAHFHAEDAATAGQVRDHLPQLRAQLEVRGIHSPLLTCQRGLPHRDSLPSAPRPLLEVSA